MTDYDYPQRPYRFRGYAGLPGETHRVSRCWRLDGISPNGDIYSSSDHGTSWVYVTEPPTGITAARRFIATSDSEVLLGATGGVWKSTDRGTSAVTWAQTLDVHTAGATPTANMSEWGFDG